MMLRSKSIFSSQIAAFQDCYVMPQFFQRRLDPRSQTPGFEMNSPRAIFLMCRCALVYDALSLKYSSTFERREKLACPLSL